MSGTNPLPAGQWASIARLGAGNLAAGNTGLNGGFGGQGASNARPLGEPPQHQVRQPYLGSPPAVSAISGFGTGSGAFILNEGSDADQSQGLVAIRVGLAPAQSGTIELSFPVTPPAMSFFCDWATIEASEGDLTLTFNRPLVTGELLRLAYQWSVSN